jgi:hypothetical protein
MMGLSRYYEAEHSTCDSMTLGAYSVCMIRHDDIRLDNVTSYSISFSKSLILVCIWRNIMLQSTY